MKKYLVILLLFFLGGKIFAQENNIFKEAEDSLKIYGKQILYGKTDDEKHLANKNFMSLLEETLNNSYSYEYNFDSVITMIKLRPEDNSFRLYNWNLPKSDGTYEYYGFIQTLKKKKGKQQTFVFRLNDKKADIRIPENATLDNYRWYGCLYYKLIEVKYRKKTYYTLLGWDGNDKTSNKKVIDILTFANNGFPRFGASIFEYEKEKKTKKRIIFEYNEMALMSLKWDPSMHMIIFNHLSPTDSRFTGQYQFYGPDETFDAFEWKKGKWLYVPELDVRMEKK